MGEPLVQEAFQIVEDLEGVDSWRQMVAVLETGNPDADEEDVEFPDLVEEAKAEDGDGTLELSRSSADAKGPEPVTSRLTEMEAEMERLVRDLAAARDDRDNVTRELEEVKARFEDWQRAIALPGEAAQSPGGAREVRPSLLHLPAFVVPLVLSLATACKKLNGSERRGAPETSAGAAETEDGSCRGTQEGEHLTAGMGLSLAAPCCFLTL